MSAAGGDHPVRQRHSARGRQHVVHQICTAAWGCPPALDLKAQVAGSAPSIRLAGPMHATVLNGEKDKGRSMKIRYSTTR